MAGKANDSSSSSSDSSTEELFIPYHQRHEWSDIEIPPENEDESLVVAIAYSAKFKSVFSYFRAVLQLDERSERAFHLTTDCIELNPSNYTVWYFRRILLRDLGKDLLEELHFLEEVILNNPKNYQVWHHRRVLIEWLKDPGDEKRFTRRILGLDSKNYHAWQHRQWILTEFQNWDSELKYIDFLLDEDVRNNSAWNHRYFVISRTTKFPIEIAEREINYTLSKIKLTPNNESPWNYLRGVLKGHGYNKFETVAETCHQLSGLCSSPHLLSFMIDAIEEELSQQEEPDQILLKRALNLANDLGIVHDKLRKEYWDFVALTLNENYSTQI